MKRFSGGGIPLNINMKNFLIEKVCAQTLKDITSLGGPDASLGSIQKVIFVIIKIALDLAGMVGFIMILYASVLYVISFGDENKAETAKKTLLWSIIGMIAVAMAWFLVYFIDISLGNA